MELDDLKRNWDNIEVQIDEHMPKREVSVPNKRMDIRSRLLWKFYFGTAFTFVCLILMSTSRLWSPTKFPISWLLVFCVMIFVAILCELRIAIKIQSTSLWNSPHSKILQTVISVKKFYRQTELWLSIGVTVLWIWLSLIPSFLNTIDKLFSWCLLIIAFVLEYVWYKTNMKHLNKLGDSLEY